MNLGLFKIVGYLDFILFKIGGQLDLGLFKIKGVMCSLKLNKPDLMNDTNTLK